MTRTRGVVGARGGRWLRGGGGLLEALESEQDRWFLWLPVLFGIGIALYFALPFEPGLAQGLAPAIIAALLAMIWRRGVVAWLATGALLALALGFSATKLRTWRVEAPVVERQALPISGAGWIELVEPRPGKGQRLTVRLAELGGSDRSTMPERVRIRAAQSDLTLQPGEAISFKATLSPPPGPALPGGFDFARSAWFQGLGGVGYTREPVTRATIEATMPWELRWRSTVERVRQAIGARITTALPGETGAIANALVTGERGGISDATNDAFRDSGLLHILSISGLHMVIMAGAVFLSVRFLLSLVPWLALNYPIKKWAAAAAAAGALGYLLISGASFPTVRSYIMISIMLLAVLLDRSAMALRNVALAALLILIVFPESLIDVGFQMSFAAVTALVSAYEWIRAREQTRAVERAAPGLLRSASLFFGGILLSTLIASLAVAPFAAFHFHKSQQYAMIANLIAIPICNVLVMPASLAALVAMTVGLEKWPLQLMGLGIDGMVWVAYRVAGLPGAVGRIPEIPTIAFGLMVAGGLWLCLWQRGWRFAGTLPIALGLLVAPMRAMPDLYVGRDGLVAVRQADGTLSALGPRNAMFDLARILEHDGDGRRPDEVAAASAFHCDWSGCVTAVRGHRIAVTRHMAAFADDCRRAPIVIAAGIEAGRLQPGVCPAALVVDREAMQTSGPRAVRLATKALAGRPELDVRTVADYRGRRPWAIAETGRLQARQPAVVAASPPPQRRLDPDDDP